MSAPKPLKIGDITVQKPIIQGGMGVGISLSSLAGAVAKAGGVGIISTAQIGFREPDFKEDPLKANLRAIKKELDKARAAAPDGVIGFNIMVATRQYPLYVKAAVQAGADLIISGAGLPVSLPEYVLAEADGQRRTKIAPIVSSAKSASVICKMWDRKYQTVPDLVVIEGPLAGGHLGFSTEQLSELGADTPDRDKTYRQDLYDEEIRKILQLIRQYEEKYQRKIPVVSAGGIYTHEDVMHQLELGVDGVQVATRFVTTRECDAPDAYKQAYIRAKREDIVLTKSPVGMPGRAIRNAFLERAAKERIPHGRCHGCITSCRPGETPYCITEALIAAVRGDVENGLLFAGENAWKARKMEHVAEIMEELSRK